MNKFMKGSLITVGILLVLGFILVGIALLFGGGSIKNNHFGYQIWNQIPFVFHNNNFEDTFEDTFVGSFYMNNDAKSGERKEESIVISAVDIENLDIELGSVQLVIEDSEDEDFHIESNTNRKYEYQVDNETLSIEGLKGSKFLYTPLDKVTLQIPQNSQFKEVKIGIGAGYIEIMELNADKIMYKGGASATYLTKLVGEDIKVEMGVGDLEIENVEAEKLEIIGGVGTVNMLDGKIKNGIITIGIGETYFAVEVDEELRIEGGVGDMELVLEGKKEDYMFEISGGIGNVSIGESSYGGIIGENIIGSESNQKILISNGVGNIDIDFE